MTKTETKEVMKTNSFEMTGRITFVEVKYSGAGNAYTRVLMSKKRMNEDVYDTFPFMFFGDMAEDFAAKVKKGDTVNIQGTIGVDSYEKDGKKIERLQLIGRSFELAEYNEERKGYVAVNKKAVPWA